MKFSVGVKLIKLLIAAMNTHINRHKHNSKSNLLKYYLLNHMEIIVN